MNLANGIMRPGKVLEVLYGGSIKASAPGLFNIEDDPEDLPPILPLVGGTHTGSISQITTGDDVWILNFSDNLQQLYWIKKYNFNNAIPNIVNHGIGRNIEVICNRKAGGEWCSIYFDDGTGWIISKGDSIIQICVDGSIVLSIPTANRCLHINENNISIGSPNTSAHPAAFGDTIEEILTSLCLLLNGVATKALTNPHTAAIGTELLKTLPQIVNKIPEISSENVTVD
jgi:hypothetical protein